MYGKLFCVSVLEVAEIPPEREQRVNIDSTKLLKQSYIGVEDIQWCGDYHAEPTTAPVNKLPP